MSQKIASLYLRSVCSFRMPAPWPSHPDYVASPNESAKSVRQGLDGSTGERSKERRKCSAGHGSLRTRVGSVGGLKTPHEHLDVLAALAGEAARVGVSDGVAPGVYGGVAHELAQSSTSASTIETSSRPLYLRSISGELPAIVSRDARRIVVRDDAELVIAAGASVLGDCEGQRHRDGERASAQKVQPRARLTGWSEEPSVAYIVL